MSIIQMQTEFVVPSLTANNTILSRTFGVDPPRDL